MLKYNQDLPIENLSFSVYEDLVQELNKDDRWRIIAQYVSKQLNFSSLWIRDLEIKGKMDNVTPAKALLIDLNTKLCTVGILSYLLKETRLESVFAILHEPEPLIITHHPSDDVHSNNFHVPSGSNLYLKCEAQGLPPPTYQWYHEDKKLESETSNELNIIVKSMEQKGFYKCVICQIDHRGEKLDEKFTRSVHVDVEPTPVRIIQEPPSYLEVNEGDPLVLSCLADCYPPARYQWYRDNNLLDDQISNVMKIDKFNDKDEGKYHCHIANAVSEKYTRKSIVSIELPRQKAVAKIALLIANENYDNHKTLRTPRNDVEKVANILNSIGFLTICLADLTLNQMNNAIKIFSESLIEGTYGLFYFAGHGFKMQENYMLSIDAPTNYLRKDTICESQLLSMGLKNDPALFIVILDMCQTIPPKETNPKIHVEVPPIHEYKGRKNLRNLLQAYSTSSYRPCYERMSKNYSFYATHLCKYLDENIPVTKVFEQVGRSIDSELKGKERKQIPMFATTITKSYRLTDGIIQGEVSKKIINLEKSMIFSNANVEVNFQESGINCKAVISSYLKPYLNLVQISLIELSDKLEINFYNFVSTERNNLFQCCTKNKCWIRNPQNNKGPLVISLSENGKTIGATLLETNNFVPSLLKQLNL